MDAVIPLPLSLLVFDTAKGHFGRTDIYQRAINDLAMKAPLGHFRNLIVHLKVAPGEEKVAAEQDAFYRALGFTVVTSHAAWQHFQPSHQQEYARDLIKVYGLPQVATTDYVLHLESDWLFEARGDRDLIGCFGFAMSYLRANPAALCVRFPRFTNEVERLNGLKAKHNLDVRTQREAEPWQSFIRHNDRLSMNPFIARSRDLYCATRLLKQHFGQFGHHVEHGFTHCLDWMADGELPYAIIDPAEAGVLHIGTKAGEEDQAGGTLAT